LRGARWGLLLPSEIPEPGSLGGEPLLPFFCRDVI